jgi:hypothetical protein
MTEVDNEISRTSSTISMITAGSLTVVLVAIIALALYISRVYQNKLIKFKIINSTVSKTSSNFSLSRRRRKLMEDYFNEDIEERFVDNSETCSSDLEESTDFINISNENQRSIY